VHVHDQNLAHNNVAAKKSRDALQALALSNQLFVSGNPDREIGASFAAVFHL
jgi:hypothetical protein